MKLIPFLLALMTATVMGLTFVGCEDDEDNAISGNRSGFGPGGSLVGEISQTHNPPANQG